MPNNEVMENIHEVFEIMSKLSNIPISDNDGQD
jgi:hypothetical protein